MVKRLVKTVRQAGGIVVRTGRGKVRVLVVTARRNPERWVFPKGTVKRGEEPADAAVREVEEEAGVTGRVIDQVGTTRYASRDGWVRLDYFLIAYGGPHVEESEEEREIVWCAMEDAMRILSDRSARRILRDAERHILRHAVRRRGPDKRTDSRREGRRR